VSANVLGTVDQPRDARLGDVDAVLSEPGAALHWYGKHEARPLRKMGHVTLVGDAGDDAGADDADPNALLSRAREIRDSLTFQ
jgi:5-(carboxyamino)imidazole ribonucleotide synthase